MKTKEPASRPAPRKGTDGLTEKERDIMDWVCLQAMDKEIAAETGLTIWGVRGRLRRIFRVLGVRNRTGAALA